MKRDDKDTPKNDPNMSNSNASLSEDNNTVGLNDLRKNRTTTESNNDNFSDCDHNNVNARSYEYTNEKNKPSLKNIKSYSTRQHSSSVLDSDISDSDDAKQENNNTLYSSNNRKNTQPLINNAKRPLRQRRMDGSSYKMNPDTDTVISTSSNKVTMNDPVIARMQDRHRNQAKMAALRKQQILLEDEEKEKRRATGSVYSPPPKSPSVSSAFSGNHYYPQQQSPLPPMVPYMVLSPYATPMMDPYMYHSHARPLQTSMSSFPSYVSLPASLHHNPYSLYNEQQQEDDDEFDCTTNARTRSTSVLPTFTKTNIYDKGISSSQSSSDTELSTPSKESLVKEYTTLDGVGGEEDAVEADVESNNEDDSAEVDKLRQKDNHHSTSGYTRMRNTKNEEKTFNEYFDHYDKMQAYQQQQQQQWYGQQQQQQQQQQYPIYSPYYFQSAIPPSYYAGMDPYYAQQDRRTSLMSNGAISQG